MMQFYYYYVDEATSTQQLAHELAQIHPWAVVRADRQTAGRGRYDRVWRSLEGNLMATLVLSPTVAIEKLPELSLVAAVALQEAIGEMAQIKWPNDILIKGKKVAGLLLESGRSHQTQCAYALIGVGVNVVDSPAGGDILFPATNLREEGIVVGVDSLLDKFVRNIECWLYVWQEQGMFPIQAAWQRVAYGLGEVCTVRLANTTYHGIALGLNGIGALRLQQDDGTVLEITVGDVFF